VRSRSRVPARVASKVTCPDALDMILGVEQMKERVLAEFLDGRADADLLRRDLAGAFVRHSPERWTFNVESINESFLVTRLGMLRVCDAVLAGELDPAQLKPIGDCLMMSETFEFDDPDRELLADVSHCWGSPEICYPLDERHVRAFREWLVTGKNPLR
jgi:hypothetical protein